MANNGEFTSKGDNTPTKPVQGRKSQQENANDFCRFCGVNLSNIKFSNSGLLGSNLTPLLSRCLGKSLIFKLPINKRLIQNKKILAELMEKERAYRDKDSEAGDEVMVSESSDNEDSTETASEYRDHQESENSNLEPEGNSDVQYSEETASPDILLKGKGPCYYCNGENVYQRAVVKCSRCFWHDGYKICPICAHQIPVDRNHSVDRFIWCADCHAVKHIDSETLKKTHYPPSEDQDD